MGYFNLANVNSPTVPLTANTSTSNVALPCSGSMITVTNLGSNPVWCATGGSTVTATASTGNGMCVAPNTVQDFSIQPKDTTFAAISTGGSSILSISVVTGQ